MTSKNKKEMLIRVLKLRSGEEIVAVIDGVAKDPVTKEMVYKCLEPAFPAMNPDNPHAMAFMPWMMFAADRTFMISRAELVLDPKEVDEQFENEYKKFFAKGMDLDVDESKDSNLIITPNKSKIITKPGT